MKNKKREHLWLFFLIFFLSGFSGLIYESIWSRYLKLFLGTSAYAQMLVIIIFMGGMALGSALAAKYSYRFKNLILLYGLCELVIGLFGLGFHNIFTFTSSAFYEYLAPSLGNAHSVTSAKFGLAALIILPQSVLLGATFPLITSGLIRRFPENSGKTISSLYFLNSIGAAIGVLSSALFFIPAVGLPGAALSSGIINIILGLLVYLLTKGDSTTAIIQQASVKPDATKSHLTRSLLILSLVTGLASFMYEIAWIRMLSMVLGASTDAFEIMLSVFIFGLAIGALAIKNKIGLLKNPIATLAGIQMLMGLLAMLTIFFYNYSFDLLVFFLDSIKRNDSGYVLFYVVSIVISMLIMLPATICAGTTLPLITHILLEKQSSAESAIGRVYSLNTIGAIIGVLITVFFVMPNLGLKYVIVLGAVADFLMGLYLFYRFSQISSKIRGALITFIVFSMSFVVVFINLDYKKMASSVFRQGMIPSAEEESILFAQDGKISTVVVKEYKNDLGGANRVIVNNGKPDAAVNISGELPALDEPTMYLLGALPFLYTNASNLKVANIGFGSGLTAEMLLTTPKLGNLDTIEIEEKVIDASKLFYPKVDRVFTDPRSNIVIDDAKTFFASNNVKYDMIIAEPPNPWVSGVASLFTQEWYTHIKRYLNKSGIYAQWIQFYELDTPLFATIYRALRKEFKYVHIYSLANDLDTGLIASNEPLSKDTKYDELSSEMRKILKMLGLSSDELLASKYIGNEKLIDDYLTAKNYHAVNSDYFPILDNNATKARFLNARVFDIPSFASSRVIQMLYGNKYVVDNDPKFSDQSGSFGKSVRNVQRELKEIVGFLKDELDESVVPSSSLGSYSLLKNCSQKNTVAVSEVVSNIISLAFDFVPAEGLNKAIQQIRSHCEFFLSKETIALLDSTSMYLNKNYGEVVERVNHLVDKEETTSIQLIRLYLAASLESGKPDKEKVKFFLNFIKDKKIDTDPEITLLLYLALTKS